MAKKSIATYYNLFKKKNSGKIKIKVPKSKFKLPKIAKIKR